MQRLRSQIEQLWNWLQSSILCQAILIAYAVEGLTHIAVSVYALRHNTPLMIAAAAPFVHFLAWIIVPIAIIAIKTWRYFRGNPQP